MLEGPTSVAVDNSGAVYEAEIGNYVIRKISGGTISIVPLAYYGVSNPDLFPYTSRPIGLAVDSAGTLYYTDPDYGVINKVAGGVVTTIAGSYGQLGFRGDGGPPLAALLNEPTGIVNVLRSFLRSAISLCCTRSNKPG